MSLNETNEQAAAIALAALGWTLQDNGRAERLLALTGLTPDDLRNRLGDPSVLAAILGFLESYEPDLIACADALDIQPSRLISAKAELER